MPPTPSLNRQRSSRQQAPVSCRSCRSRKLRCNRESPCSNCVSRGIPCQPSGPRREPAATRSSADTTVAIQQHTPEAQLIERIARLEEFLALRSQIQQQARQHDPSQPQTMPTISDAEQLSLIPSIDIPMSSQVKSGESLLFQETRSSDLYLGWLQQMAPPQISRISMPNIHISFQILSMSDIKQDLNSPSSSIHRDSAQQGHIILPSASEAQALADNFIQTFNDVYHLIHEPNIQVILQVLYNQEGSLEQATLGQAFLGLSMFVFAIHTWLDHNGEFKSSIDSSLQIGDATVLGSFWMSKALELLDYHQKRFTTSLELVQGAIILSNVLASIEGPSHRYRCLLNRAIVMAQDLHLHINDHPRARVPTSQIDAEVRRRIWWYLVSTDWLQSTMSSTHEGIYQVSPQQMLVNRPLNLEDEDIVGEICTVGKPSSEATAMSYFLQRLRLAEIVRGFVDKMPLASATIEGPSYGDIIEADIELDRFINALPQFFRLGYQGSTASDGKMNESHGLIAQRYFINVLAHFYRCKLHLPYLPRGFTDPTYSYSRTTCLKAAKVIVEAELELEAENITLAGLRLRSTGYLHGIFIAGIALVKDACLRGMVAQQDVWRGPTAHSLRILKDASLFSETAASLLNSLKKSLENEGLVTVHPPKSRAHEAPIGAQLDPLLNTVFGSSPQLSDGSYQRAQNSSYTLIENTRPEHSYINLEESAALGNEFSEDWSSIMKSFL